MTATDKIKIRAQTGEDLHAADVSTYDASGQELASEADSTLSMTGDGYVIVSNMGKGRVVVGNTGKFNLSNYLSSESIKRDARRYLSKWQIINSLKNETQDANSFKGKVRIYAPLTDESLTEENINSAFVALKPHLK